MAQKRVKGRSFHMDETKIRKLWTKALMTAQGRESPIIAFAELIVLSVVDQMKQHYNIKD